MDEQTSSSVERNTEQHKQYLYGVHVQENKDALNIEQTNNGAPNAALYPMNTASMKLCVVANSRGTHGLSIDVIGLA